MAQYVYTMNRVGKIVPPKRVILKDISLSFFPGAKIGVLGLNGSGKSSLLRDHGRRGQGVRRRSGADAEHAHRLPAAGAAARRRTRRCARPSKRAWAKSSKPSRSSKSIYAAYAEPDADFDALAAEQAKLRGASSPRPAPTPTCRWKSPPTRCDCAPWDAKIGKLSGGEKRRVALCRLLLSKPDMLLLDEPTNHLDAESVEWLEQFLLRFPGTVIAVTHDRYFLDNAAEWILELDRGYGIPWKGNYSSWLEQKEQRLEIEAKQESARIKAMHKELEWVRTNPKGAAGEEQGAHRPLRRAVQPRASEAQRDAGNLHPGRRATRRPGDRAARREQGLRRAPADRRSLLQRAAGRDRRHHRPERRGQDDACSA